MLEATNCPNDCNYLKGHGHCNMSTGVCYCNPQWGGDDCSLPNPEGAYVFTTQQCKDNNDCEEPYTCSDTKKVCALECTVGEYAKYDQQGWLGYRAKTHREACPLCKWNRQTCLNPSANLKNFCTGKSATDNSKCDVHPATLYCVENGVCYDDHNVAMEKAFSGEDNKDEWRARDPDKFCQDITKYYKSRADNSQSFPVPQKTYKFHEQKLTHSDKCRYQSLSGDAACGVDGSCCNNPTTASGKSIPPDTKPYNCYGVKKCDDWDTGFLKNTTWGFYDTYLLKCQLDPDNSH
jgi:hypothetical protein